MSFLSSARCLAPAVPRLVRSPSEPSRATRLDSRCLVPIPPPRELGPSSPLPYLFCRRFTEGVKRIATSMRISAMTPRTKTNHSHRVRERTFLGASPTSTSSANDARLFFFLFSTRASSRETAAGKAASSTVAAESVAPRDETTPPRPGLAGTAERDESRRSSSRDGEGETSSSIVNMANAFLSVPPLARGATEGRVGAGADPDPVRALPCFTRRGVNPSSSSFTVPTAGTESARGSIASVGEDGGVGERTNGQRESPGGRRVGACENRVGGNLNASRATTDVPTAGSSRLSRDGAPANSSGSSSGNISLLLFFRLFPMMAMTRAAASGAEGVSKPGAAGVAS